MLRPAVVLGYSSGAMHDECLYRQCLTQVVQEASSSQAELASAQTPAQKESTREVVNSSDKVAVEIGGGTDGKPGTHAQQVL